MNRSTAIGRLVEMAEVATERPRLRDADIGWPLEEMWVAGDLLRVADMGDLRGSGPKVAQSLGNQPPTGADQRVREPSSCGRHLVSGLLAALTNR